MENKFNQTECAICLDSFNEQCITLNCGHIFHRQCLSDMKKRECPLCRMSFDEKNTVEEEKGSIDEFNYMLSHVTTGKNNIAIGQSILNYPGFPHVGYNALRLVQPQTQKSSIPADCLFTLNQPPLVRSSGFFNINYSS